jgi:hypothetical protein
VRLDPHLPATLLLTTSAALLMMLAGLEKHVLDRRHQRRRCPSCGRRSCRCV